MPSRISVELVGQSSELQAAVARGADSLKVLGDVLKKQTDAAAVLGDRTVRSNELVAKSYESVAVKAGAASDKTIAALERQGGVALGTSKEQISASERTVVALEEQATAATRSADAQVRANDLAAASAVRSADRQVASAAKTERAFGASSSSLSKAGKVISLGLLGAAAASVDLAVKFQSNTLRMETQAGATAGQLDKLRKGILGMAAAVGYTPNQLANGMYHVVSSMNAVLPAATRVSEELHIMRIAAEGAQIGHSNLEDTTYALVSAMNALHQRGGDASKTMGELNAIVGSGDMTMQDLLEALKSGLIPTANTFGVSLQSLGSALSVMGDMGMRGALAGTRLRMSLALLGSPSAKAAKELQTIGLSAHQSIADTEKMSAALQKAGIRTTQISADLKQPDGLQVALRDLDKHLRSAGLTATGAAALISSAFGGGRSGAAIALMAENTGRLKTKFDQIGSSANHFGSDWTKTTHSAAFELHSFEGGVVSLATRLGTDLLPYLNTGVQDLTDVVHWFEKGNSAAHALEIGIGTLATVAIGSYLTSKLIAAIKLMREFGSVLTSPLGAMSRFGAASRPGGAGGLGTALGGGGGMGIGGAKTGFGLPGSLANPIIVAIEAGEYAGLGSMGASGTVATEAKVAAAETGAVESAGVGAAAVGGTAAAEGAAAAALVPQAEKYDRTIGQAVTGALSTGMGALSTGLGSLLKGGLIAGGGLMASQLAGNAIGGNTGRAVSTIGTATSIGAGVGSLIGPEGTLAGGITGALVGGFAAFMSHDANKYGNDIAGAVTKDLPVAVSSSYSAGLAKALNYAHNLKGLTAAPGQIPYGAPNAIPNSPHASRGGSIPAAQDIGAVAAHQMAVAGAKAGAEFVASFDKVKFPSEPAIFNDFMKFSAKLPVGARDAAAKAVVEMTQGLQSKGQLPKNATANLIYGMESQFPGLASYLKDQGLSTAADVANSMKMTAARSQLQQTIANMTSEFGYLPTDVHVTGQNMGTQLNQAMSTLKADMTQGTTQMRQAATQQYNQLKQQAVTDFTAMAQQVASHQADITGSIISGSAQAANSASTSMFNLASNIASAMSSGTIAASKGTQIIGEALNKALLGFGEKPLGLTTIAGATAGQLAAVASGQVSSGALASRTERGGLFQFGTAGDRGRDKIPVNMGGTPIVVGSGEVGAVLTGQQQQVANTMMAPIGGLPGLFSNFNAKHYMAQGGFVPGGRYGTGALGSPGAVNAPGTGSVILDPGVNMSVGQEPQILNDLKGLSAELRNVVYVISGYRSPAHSVQVGGFANDPHTRGEAADIGVGSPSLASMFGVAEAQLRAVGLYRPFYPPAAKEANHVQLLAGGASGKGFAGSVSGGLAAAAAVWKNINAPAVGGPGTIPAIVRGALALEAKAANKYGQAHMPAGGGSFSGTLNGSAEHQIQQFFSAAGMNKIAIAGLIGNAVQESGVNWNTPGGGMWQQISNFGSGAPSPLVQMSTMLGQIRGLIPAMNNAGSPGNAATIFMNQFERPNAALANLPRRIAGANSAYAAGYGQGGLVKMYDATAGSLSSIPKDAGAVASYVDNYGGYSQAKGMFPHIPVTSISVTPGNNARADIYDVEPGGKSAGEAIAAILSGRTKGAYGGAGDLGSIKAALGAKHIARNAYKLWLAAWPGSGANVAGGYDAHQYASNNAFDTSVALQSFFGAGSTPASKSKKPLTPAQKAAARHLGTANQGIVDPFPIGGEVIPPAQAVGGPGTGGKGLQGLASAGTSVSGIEGDLVSKLGQYTSLSSRFSALEQSPQFLNADGSVNAAGIAQTKTDDLTLLSLAESIYGDYQAELPLVTNALKKYLGVKSSTDTKLAANKRKLAANKIKEEGLRTAILDLGKPSANVVGALETQIKLDRGKYGGLVAAAETKRSTYHGKDKPTKTALAQVVVDARSAEHSVLAPLQSALISAQSSQSARKQTIKAKSFSLRQQLQGLIKDDTKLRTDDTGLQGILSGANGAQGTNSTVSALESVASKLGTVEWGKAGRFVGIDTTNQGAAFDEYTTIIQLGNTLAALGTASTATADNSAMVALLQQQLTISSETNALQAGQLGVLRGELPEIPQYAKGGPILQDGLIYAHAGEHVVPQGGTLVATSGSPTIEVHNHIHGEANGLIRTIRSEIRHPDNVRAVSRQIGQRVSQLRGAPGGGR